MQLFTDNIPDSGDQYGVDLTNIKNNFSTLKSMFSGTSAPPNTVEGMPWLDMNANKAWKVRDKANANWLGFMVGDVNQKIWVYRNAAMDGWAIDASVVDVVLALKGGSNAYNVAGGIQGGSWQQEGHSLSQAELPNVNTNASSHTHSIGAPNLGGGGILIDFLCSSDAETGTQTRVSATCSTETSHVHSLGGSGTAHNHGLTWRPAAAVGTLQYVNI